MPTKSTKQKKVEAAIIEAAEKYFEAGLTLSLAPLRDNDESRRLMWWWTPDTCLDDIKKRLKPTYSGCTKLRFLGIVTGEDGLESLEVTSQAHVKDFMEMVEKEMPDLFARVVQQRTGFGHGNLIYRIEGEVPEKQKLAYIRKSVPIAGWYVNTEGGEPELTEMGADCAKEVKGTPGDWYCDFSIIVTQGAGGRVACPPSKGWEILNGDLLDIPTITKEEREQLFAIARSFDNTGRKAIIHENGELEWEEDQVITRPSAKFNRVNGGEEIVVLLKKHGWKVVKRDSGACHLRRYGKDTRATISIRWVDGTLINRDPWVTEFKLDKLYFPLEIYAHLEHRGDLTSAVKALNQTEEDSNS